MRSGKKEAARKNLLERRPNFYETAPIETIAFQRFKLLLIIQIF